MAQPSNIDVIPGYDPTGTSSITAAQLLQMVGGVTPNIDKGFILITTDVGVNPTVPNAAVVTKWQNYIWLRISPASTGITAYVWNPNGATDATYSNWVTISSASISPGSITGNQIATNTISAANIISIESSQITGSVPPAWLAQLNLANTAYATNGLLNTSSPVFGDLTGSTLGVPVITAQAVTLAKMAFQSVAGSVAGGSGVGTGSNIVDSSIYPVQLSTTGNTPLTSIQKQTTGAVDPTANIIVPAKSILGKPSTSNYTASQNVAAGDILAAMVNSSGTFLGFVTNSRAILTLADPAANTVGISIPVAQAGAATYVLSTPDVLQGGLKDTNNAYHPVGRILQVVETNTTAMYSSSGTIAQTQSGANINYNATGMNAIAGLNTAITPLSASSTLFIDVDVTAFPGASNAYFFLGVYVANGATAPSASTAIYTSELQSLHFRFKLASPGTSAITVYPAFAVSTGTAHLNSIDGSTALYGGTTMSLRVTEYI